MAQEGESGSPPWGGDGLAAALAMGTAGALELALATFVEVNTCGLKGCQALDPTPAEKSELNRIQTSGRRAGL